MRPAYWTPRRRSTAFALGIGWGVGLLPLFGLRTRLALLLGTLFRSHLPTAVVGTFISNPFTLPAILAVQYLAGSWMRPLIGLQDFPWPGSFRGAGGLVVILSLGSVATAVVGGFAGLVYGWVSWGRDAQRR